MRRFYLSFFIATSLCIAGAYAAAALIPGLGTVPVSFWFAFGFIALLTFGIHHLLVKANEQRAQRFVAYFMGALSIKLFFSCVVLVAVGFLDPDGLVFTALAYLLCYFIYTGVEIADLLPRMRNTSAK